MLGTVVTEQGKRVRVAFKEVLILPELRWRQLLSVRRIGSLGGKVIFSKVKATIQMQGMELRLRKRSNGGADDELYELDAYERGMSFSGWGL